MNELHELGELDVLAPPTMPVAVGGSVLEVTPLRVGEIAPFARALAPLADALPLLLAAGEPSTADLLALLGDHGEHALQALAVASRQPLAWVQALLPHEAVELAAACVEVNVDFFRRAQPSLARHGTRLAAVFSAGQTPSHC